MIKKIGSSLLIGLFISIGFFGGVFLLVKASGLTATSGTPLTADSWNTMVSNFFWGSGTSGIYYNGKVGIGTSSPNKALHVYDTTNNAEIDIQSVAGAGKHWAIYQDSTTQELRMRNGFDRVKVTTGGNLNAQGLCINGVCKTDWNQISGGGGSLNTYTGTCDTTHRGYSGIINGTLKICNGSYWRDLLAVDNYFAGAGSDTDPYRLSNETANAPIVEATSCQYYNLHALTLNNGNLRESGTCYGSKACLSNGVYRITVGGSTANVYCDMTNDGGGWTFIVGIDGANQNHNSSSSVTPSNLVTTSGKGKYADSFINGLRAASGSEGIVKLICGSTDYFDYRTNVWHATYSAYPNGVGWDVYTQPWGTAPHSGAGLSWGNQPGPWSHNSWGQVLIYGYNGWTGCYNGSSSSQNGTVYIR